ncbi:tRNA-dihydrouridine synthase family protein [Spirochaeta lutea]|uniref:DUS-like FMN-binding domain-containing protein n=1 Tax=Spirochaeta lutea TaxID=1480694 RepID=A0A098QYF6_9SPIO|nr:tRNA-dihydrouridine synthase family protein [Spirochaeta lutea]KGE72709.1 hypothetical protein DC28_06610 [Spirochaeta lutea]
MPTAYHPAGNSFLSDLHASVTSTSPKPLVLAPIATMGHPGFRSLIADFSSPRAFWTEMISAEALANRGTYEEYYLDPRPQPENLIIQLLWRNPEALEPAIDRIHQHMEGLDADWIGLDLNLGCSAPQIVRSGAGISWLSKPDRLTRLLSRLRKKVPTRTLSVKIRLPDSPDGRDDKDYAHVRALGSALAETGIDFITLHPRTRKQGYSRPAQWNAVSCLQEALTIPVIGNGDIQDLPGLDIRSRYSSAGLMVGRAVIQQPWFFLLGNLPRLSPPSPIPGRIQQGNGAPGPWELQPSAPGLHTALSKGLMRWRGSSLQVDLLTTAKAFHAYLEQFQPEDFWITRTKRFYAYYTKNLLFGHRIGASIQNLRDYRAMESLFTEYLGENPEHRWKTVFEDRP